MQVYLVVTCILSDRFRWKGLKMRYFHVTLACNLASIRKRGLLCRYARGKRQAVWIVRQTDLLWAVAHTAGKAWAKGQKLAIVSVDVKAAALKRHSSERCLWVAEDVPPSRLAYPKLTVGDVCLC
jgi:hypothetical protein